ncbi:MULTISPECIES: sensor domain-containing diguanylate cyclase [Persephonella]|uniref:Diguanylate cyclase/phosphodiesterase domain 1 n=1 Tax=Persephonella marina (strain DSM 14350 / EX-H1) TaxID=123214 RepID=C0QPE2_PERMH|nr:MULTISPECIES: sensor domain-containing diguanylate cyclase [Persephonella]ACO03416.1 diguanylate cyclase/phosphodiesterase domain 1 [Persephonella marina EX-H1]
MGDKTAEVEKLRSEIERLKKQIEEKNRYKTIVENAGEAIVILQGGYMKYLNPKAASLVGIPREKLLNSTFEQFIHPEDKQMVLNNYINRLQGKPAPESYTFRIRDINLQTKWLQIRPVKITYEGKPAILNFFIDITKQKELEKILEKTNSILRWTIESLSDGIVVVDLNFNIILYNQNFLNIWGVKDEDLEDTTRFLYIASKKVVYEKMFLKRIDELRKDIYASGKGRLTLLNGRIYEWYSIPFKVQNRVSGRIWHLKDITEKIQAEAALREREKNYRELVENVNSIVLRWKPDGTITFINRFGEKFFGYKRKELIGKNVCDTIVPQCDSEGNNLHQMIEDITRNPNRYVNNENENMTKDGKRVWILWKNRPVYDSDNNLIEIFSIGHDITEKKILEKKLEKLATTDGLTGIYNRVKFEEILEEKLRDFSLNGSKFCLFLFDIDNFKKINDSYGHHRGDHVLKEVVNVVRRSLRNDSLFARWGGEEFIILFPNTDLKSCFHVVDGIRKMISRHVFDVVGRITISGGITEVLEGDDSVSIVRRADNLLYKAKGSGKNIVMAG